MTSHEPSNPVTIGELFPSDDLIGQWVFQMTAVVAGLSITDALLHDALDTDAGAVHSGYHYRQLVTRLYEAKRPVISVAEIPAIRDWTAGIPGLAAGLGVLSDAYLPGGDSKVDEAYALMRHQSVHHSSIGSAEFAANLAAAADEEAWIHVDHDKTALDYEWPEVVLMRALLGDLSVTANVDAFKERIRFATQVAHAHMSVTRLAVEEHASRMGVDPARYHRFTGTR